MLTMYPVNDDRIPVNHPSRTQIPPSSEDDERITLAEFHNRWKDLHDEYFRTKDEALQRLLDGREALRQKLHRPIG